MDPDYSLEALNRFLGFVGEKGLVNKATARNWRVAVANLFVDLTPDEEADVRKINVDIAARRFINRQPGAVTPESLTTYRQRATLAVRHFVSYASNPAGYKPTGMKAKTNGTNGKSNGNDKSSRKPVVAQTSAASQTSNPGTMVASDPAKDGASVSTNLPVSFPLRGGDFMVQMVIPRDLTAAEAKKMGKMLIVMAQDSDPDDL